MTAFNPLTTPFPRSLGLALAALVLCVLAPTPVRAQPVEWTERVVSGPSPRQYHAMAYDAARGVTVLFGGFVSNGNGNNGETWEWNGTSWSQRLVNGPALRHVHAMAYDAAREVTVLFGGRTETSLYNGETWEWNGTVWTQRSVTGPSPRLGHAMTYDVARGVTVLFGGADGINNSSETWEWDGTAWTQRVVTGPSSRSAHTMAYDSDRGVIVLFGGSTAALNGETWEWNGTVWNQRFVGGPSPRTFPASVYDAVRGVTVLFGGFTGQHNGETWEWNGTVWTQRAVDGPSPRHQLAMTFDGVRGVSVLFGGDSGYRLGDTWELGVPCLAPSIDAQPVAQTVFPEDSASFQVTAAGTGPFTYRWQRKHGGEAWTTMIDGLNYDPTGVPLFDATGTLSESVTTDPPAADTTYPVIIWDVPLTFRCIVTNGCDNTTTSAETTLTVTCGLPAIDSLPASVEVTPCQTATFSVQATSHYPESYRWRRNGVNLNNNTRISGVTTDTLTISPVGYFLGGNYDVVVTNQCGSVTSAAAQLILLDPADFDGDGDSGTDLDIEAFFTCLGGDCCSTCGSPDFDGDGDAGTDLDIESFFRVLGGGNC